MIIEVDEYKKFIQGYDPNNSESFHKESGQIADRIFIESLKSQKYKRIIFMAGGTASGKTEYAKTYLNKKDQLVYDGTLKSYEGFIVKTQKINRYSKNHPKIKVVLMIPKDIGTAFDAFLDRERKMNINTFFITNIESRRTVAKILLETKTKVEIYISSVSPNANTLEFIHVKTNNRKLMAQGILNTIDVLEKISELLKIDLTRNL